MNIRRYKWLYNKATNILGKEEMDSLKNDLLTPVKIAVKDAAADIVGDMKRQYSDKTDEK